MSTTLSKPTSSSLENTAGFAKRINGRPGAKLEPVPRSIEPNPERFVAPDIERGAVEAIIAVSIDLWNLGRAVDATSLILHANELAWRNRWCHFGGKCDTTKNALGCVQALRSSFYIDQPANRDVVKVLKKAMLTTNVRAADFVILVRLARLAANVEFEVRLDGHVPARQPTPAEIRAAAAEFKEAGMERRKTEIQAKAGKAAAAEEDLRADQLDSLRVAHGDEAEDEAAAWAGSLTG